MCVLLIMSTPGDDSPNIHSLPNALTSRPSDGLISNAPTIRILRSKYKETTQGNSLKCLLSAPNAMPFKHTIDIHRKCLAECKRQPTGRPGGITQNKKLPPNPLRLTTPRRSETLNSISPIFLGKATPTPMRPPPPPRVLYRLILRKAHKLWISRSPVCSNPVGSKSLFHVDAPCLVEL